MNTFRTALSDMLGRRPVLILGTPFITAFAVPLSFMSTSQLLVLVWGDSDASREQVRSKRRRIGEPS